MVLLLVVIFVSFIYGDEPSCPSGMAIYYPDSNTVPICVSCTSNGEPNCRACTAQGPDTTTCFLCNDEYVLDSAMHCVSCGDETRGGFSDCDDCTIRTINSQETITCTSCTSGLYLSVAGTACVAAAACEENSHPNFDKCVCDDGYVLKDEKCVLPCPKGYEIASEIVLETCPVGYYKDDKKCTCTPCGSTISNCQTCTIGFRGTPKCLYCGDHGWINADGTCRGTCSERECILCSGDAEYPLCHLCKDGFLVSPEMTCIPQFDVTQVCPNDYVVISGTKYCTRCGPGSVSINGICTSLNGREGILGCTNANNDGTCLLCSGRYLSIGGGCFSVEQAPGMLVCSETKNGDCISSSVMGPALNYPGLYVQNGKLQQCPSNCSSCTETTCIECRLGYYMGSEGCIACNQTQKGCGTCIDSPLGFTCLSWPKTTLPVWATVCIVLVCVTILVVVAAVLGWWFGCRKKRANLLSVTSVSDSMQVDDRV
ncbi:High cysteine membrane protein [Giardia muris]|uniref:High cysteine membrane protein n=1 Tax=Giardia muris TaxID=5742 RepID=A0A4Z1ST04_GIAMU|nr:High cysteine membrane protein [Giardia muris]|eukprot:TNJ28125.1 High cysteine membrane protein [Giardia muris]